MMSNPDIPMILSQKEHGSVDTATKDNKCYLLFIQTLKLYGGDNENYVV